MQPALYSLDKIAPRRLKAGLVAVLLVANAFVCGLAAYSLQQSRLQYEARARGETQNLVRAITQNVANSVEKVNLTLQAVVDELERQLAAGGIDAEAMQAMFARHLERLPEIEAIRVADADGLVFLGKGVRKEARASWADREYFTYLRDHADGGLQISKPRIGRVAQQYIVGFARRYNGPDGRFAGVVSAPVAVEHFSTLLSSFDTGANGTLVLRDSDLGLVTRHPPLPGKPAGTIGNSEVSRELRALVEAGASDATFYTDRGADGEKRILSLLRVGNAPLLAVAGVGYEAYLADWRDEARNTLLLLAAFVALSLLSALFLWQMFDRILGDIAARKASEARLAESELQLKTIIETEPECVKLLSLDGRLLQMNRAGLDMIEADALEQVRGQPVVDLILPEYRADFTALNETVRQGGRGTLEFEVQGLKGGRRWLETHAVPMLNSAGAVTALLGVTRDVTARKQSEAMQLEARRAAEAANLAKSQFLATMSHEIRTPLNGILGMAQLLLMPETDEAERREFARTILNSGQTLLAILNDILDLSKIDAGRMTLLMAVFEPRQLIEESVALFAEMANSKGLAIEIDWQGPAGQRYHGDPVRLRQMLSNFLSNAIKFTDTGRIRVAAREDAPAGDAHAGLTFAVTDTGIGISEQQRDKLFKPFSQLDGSHTRNYGGTGLGLSIVRSLARLMGGEVGVTSTPGAGSTFWFRIHAARVAPGEESRAAARPAQSGAAEGAAAPPAAARILLAEDNQTNRLVIEAMLRRWGYAYRSVENGRAAVEALQLGAWHPDLVLMDCQMPLLDGFAATAEIRAWEKASGRLRLPIVALTAGAFSEDRAHCLAAGMDDFLAKPIDMQQFREVLRKWLEPVATSV